MPLMEVESKYASPEGFDEDYIKRVAERSPRWAAELAHGRAMNQMRLEDLQKKLESAQQFFGYGPPQTPRSLADVLNAKQVPNPNKASPIAPPWIGVRW